MGSNQLPVILEATKNVAASGEIPLEKINEIYNFSHQLVATDTLDILLESIVQYAVEIVQVSFCKIFTLENDQMFSSKAVYYKDVTQNPVRLNTELDQSKTIQNYFKNILQYNQPFIISASKQILEKEESRLFEFYSASQLCFVPMRVNSEKIGLLILGDQSEIIKDGFDDDKIRLSSLIADLAASAIHRVSLSKILKSNQIETVLALAKTIEARDPYTGGHSKKVVDLAVKTAKNMNLSTADIQTIRMAAFLHDIGKISVPDEILKKPGPLTDDEWAVMKKHPDVGADIILSVSKLAYVAPLVRFHHEKYNGSGYPYGLQGDWIPLGARILSVVDAYSAITDGRVYKSAKPHEYAMQEIIKCSGSEFDPKVVAAFINSFED